MTEQATTPAPGDKVSIKFNEDLGPISGQQVEIIDGPDGDGMYRVRLVATAFISADDIRP